MKLLAQITKVQVANKATITARDKSGHNIMIEVPGPQVAGLKEGHLLVLEWAAFEPIAGDAPSTLDSARQQADTAFVSTFLK